jgi:hypothetical protein
MVRSIRWSVFLPCLTLLGCQVFTSPYRPTDPLVEEIVVATAKAEKQKTATPVSPPARVSPADALVLEEIPLQTPIAKARANMERHGFSCWYGVPEGQGICLHCTAWKPRSTYLADRIVVRLCYENGRVVNVKTTVEREIWHPTSPPNPRTPNPPADATAKPS